MLSGTGLREDRLECLPEVLSGAARRCPARHVASGARDLGEVRGRSHPDPEEPEMEARPLMPLDFVEPAEDRRERRRRLALPQRRFGDGHAERTVELRLDREAVDHRAELLDVRGGSRIPLGDEQGDPLRQAVPSLWLP